MTSLEIVTGLIDSRGQWSFFELPSCVQAAIIATSRAVLDAAPDEGGRCFYCYIRPTEDHAATCPVPVARCLLTYTDD